MTMDRFMGTVTNELATISGLELTVAPRRAAHMTHKCVHCLTCHLLWIFRVQRYQWSWYTLEPTTA